MPCFVHILNLVVQATMTSFSVLPTVPIEKEEFEGHLMTVDCSSDAEVKGEDTQVANSCHTQCQPMATNVHKVVCKFEDVFQLMSVN